MSIRRSQPIVGAEILRFSIEFLPRIQRRSRAFQSSALTGRFLPRTPGRADQRGLFPGSRAVGQAVSKTRAGLCFRIAEERLKISDLIRSQGTRMETGFLGTLNLALRPRCIPSAAVLRSAPRRSSPPIATTKLVTPNLRSDWLESISIRRGLVQGRAMSTANRPDLACSRRIGRLARPS